MKCEPDWLHRAVDILEVHRETWILKAMTSRQRQSSPEDVVRIQEALPLFLFGHQLRRQNFPDRGWRRSLLFNDHEMPPILSLKNMGQ
jgi:hypothetical protein